MCSACHDNREQPQAPRILTPRCVRCKSSKTLPYSGVRFYCTSCGFTFHKDSIDETDEIIRRHVAMVRSDD